MPVYARKQWTLFHGKRAEIPDQYARRSKPLESSSRMRCFEDRIRDLSRSLVIRTEFVSYSTLQLTVFHYLVDVIPRGDW